MDEFMKLIAVENSKRKKEPLKVKKEVKAKEKQVEKEVEQKVSVIRKEKWKSSGNDRHH